MSEKNNLERGQTLVLVTLAFFAFMGMLVLVLDGGNAFFRRRIAQDAADAGALAGAKDYCLGEKNVNHSQGVALDYVEANGANLVNYMVDSSTIPVKVTVDAEIEFLTSFANLFGRPNAKASASATSACFPPDLAAPLPVAWSCQPKLNKPDECNINVWGLEGAPNPPDPMTDPKQWNDGGYYYLIAESSESPNCIFPPNTDPAFPNQKACGGKYESGEIDCDLDDDCSDDVYGAGDKTWLDLDGGGTNTAEINEIISGGKEVMVSVHTWLGSGTGLVNSLYKTLEANVNDRFVIPIFDHVCGNNILNCSEYQTIGGEIIYSTGVGTQYYHIKEFALFKITCVRRSQSDYCPYYEYVYEEVGLKGNESAVEGYFLKGTDTNFESFFGGAGGIFDFDTGTYIIKLIK